MQKLCEFIGLPVLEMQNGKQIGEVQEVVLNIGQARVFGVVVAGAGWFSDSRGVLYGDICGLGRDALVIRDKDAIREWDGLTPDGGIYKLSELCEKPVYTEAGDYLGLVVDLACEPKTGEIRFYVLSDGLITDIIRGRLLMPLPPAQVINEERLIVPETMAELLQAANELSGGAG